MKNALILLAGGLGKRMGSKTPKQFLKIGNTNCLDYFYFVSRFCDYNTQQLHTGVIFVCIQI